jgi:hypothetical protein
VDRAEKRDGPVDGVVGEQQHALLAAHAARAQHLREPADPVGELAVGKPRAVVDVRDAIGARRIAFDEVSREVERFGRSGRVDHGACTIDDGRRGGTVGARAGTGLHYSARGSGGSSDALVPGQEIMKGFA